MSILLTILKIIGIALLVLLAVVIVLLALLLFAPFCYRVQGSFAEGKPAGKAELRYLFPLLRVSFSYEGDKKTGVIRLLGIKLFDFFAPPKQKKAKKNKKGKQKRQKEKKKTGSKRKANEIIESDTQDQQRPAMQENERSAEQSERIKPETAAADSMEKKSQEITDLKADTIDTDAMDTVTTDTPDSQEKPSLWQKIQLWICKIKEWAKKFWQTISGLYHKTISLRQKWEGIKTVLSYYAETLKKEETKSALRLAKNTLKKLWKSVGPRKGRLRVHFGTGDPGSCGEICAFLGMVYPFIGNYVMIEPEMEQAVFDCDVWFRGHITVFALLKAGWVVLFNPEIKYLKEVMKPSGKEDK
ncbi:hypothetical protein KQI22_00760 [Kineothrix sp. MSJ-39]|uniref:hypothetical protein n=1 Tax=Kineothrix sp. MSJ-39 TaxID=2841533 RepID=UPI001C0F87E8|nr:hypothetical protein [Kineothrix sp. MSJ-39]MBU5428594.1 hypothetical protein [Kineothrix sp. MSJ-39]